MLNVREVVTRYLYTKEGAVNTLLD